jgi:hypothetical protein
MSEITKDIARMIATVGLIMDPSTLATLTATLFQHDRALLPSSLEREPERQPETRPQNQT